jgi:2-polyprenyl-3-methyl-5-hydroxy-6-metoxy-1,4-benzoquinol methylase
MNQGEYRIMRDVEDIHWWYAGLRGMIRLQWARWSRADGSPARILDAGSGTGANMAMMAEHASVYGLDMSPDALALTWQRGLSNIVQASVSDSPWVSESFDGVLMMDVLYHRAVPDKSAALREAARVLKPGGILLVNVPAYQWLMSSHDTAIHTDKRFTRSELHGLLRDAGLIVERITYWNTMLFAPAALVRFLRKNMVGNTESDLGGYRETALTRFFSAVLAVERGILGILPLPFGLSVFAVARKPE